MSKSIIEPEFPDELEYETSFEANIAIIRAMGEIRFQQRMEQLMPLVAVELVRAGVDFSNAKLDGEGKHKNEQLS